MPTMLKLISQNKQGYLIRRHDGKVVTLPHNLATQEEVSDYIARQRIGLAKAAAMAHDGPTNVGDPNVKGIGKGGKKK